MARESEHKREYKRKKIVAKSKLYSEKMQASLEDTGDLSAKQLEKLNPIKPTKIARVRQGAAHAARAKQRRKGGYYCSDFISEILNKRKLKEGY